MTQLTIIQFKDIIPVEFEVRCGSVGLLPPVESGIYAWGDLFKI